MSETATFTRADVLRIAASSQTDPRTVESYLVGRRVRRASAAAIERALRAARRADLVRAIDDSAGMRRVFSGSDTGTFRRVKAGEAAA